MCVRHRLEIELFVRFAVLLPALYCRNELWNPFDSIYCKGKGITYFIGRRLGSCTLDVTFGIYLWASKDPRDSLNFIYQYFIHLFTYFLFKVKN